MRLIDFAKHFPDENSCRETFKKYREQEGIVCKKCEMDIQVLLGSILTGLPYQEDQQGQA